MATRSLFGFAALAFLCGTVLSTSQGVAQEAELIAGSKTSWVIRKDSWTSVDENNYSKFVQALGESDCNTVDKCLKSSANPYRATDPVGVVWTADCAKWPYLLRAYFAWKNHLPFGYVSKVVAVSGGGDLRYNLRGNKVAQRRDIVQDEPGQVHAVRAITKTLEEVFTATYRFSPEFDVNGDKFFDMYPVRIDRQNIRPGTVLYDPNGHVAVVYKVESDGRIHLIDTHPDNSVTHPWYGEKFVRSNPGMGAGFKNFRSLKLVDAYRDSSGEYLGGFITANPNAQSPGYSTEQYYGTEPSRDGKWRSGRFSHGGRNLGYYDFVRTRLAVGELKYKPIEELTNSMEALCTDLQERVQAIQIGVDKRIYQKVHPPRLPNNIYGTEGEWEEYSSPSRDARLKTSFREVLTHTRGIVNLYKKGSPRVVYEGDDLARDLRRAYAKNAAACNIIYKRTDGSLVRLNYNDIVRRLFQLSFDPYHCVEMRWGASSSEELATCTEMSFDKRSWYEAEQRLRYQLDRTYDVKMAFSLSELLRAVPGSGVDAPPDVDLKSYLKSL